MISFLISIIKIFPGNWGKNQGTLGKNQGTFPGNSLVFPSKLAFLGNKMHFYTKKSAYLYNEGQNGPTRCPSAKKKQKKNGPLSPIYRIEKESNKRCGFVPIKLAWVIVSYLILLLYHTRPRLSTTLTKKAKKKCVSPRGKESMFNG